MGRNWRFPTFHRGWEWEKSGGGEKAGEAHGRRNEGAGSISTQGASEERGLPGRWGMFNGLRKQDKQGVRFFPFPA